MTWSQTQKKAKGKTTDEHESDTEDGFVAYTDKDFSLRTPALKY